MEKIRTGIVGIQYNGDIIHSMSVQKLKLGNLFIKEETNRKILVLNADYYMWDRVLQEQQYSWRICLRGYFKIDSELNISDLYDCYVQTINEVNNFFQLNKVFGRISVNPDSQEKLKQEFQTFLDSRLT